LGLDSVTVRAAFPFRPAYLLGGPFWLAYCLLVIFPYGDSYSLDYSETQGATHSQFYARPNEQLRCLREISGLLSDVAPEQDVSG